MAENSRRSTSSSTNNSSKSRKSRNDSVRMTLGMHLKQKNYSAQEKFRKSDLMLTQSVEQYDVSMMLENDLAKQNTISYSNVLCLSNNQSTVEQQFFKFVRFVQSQCVPAIKMELQCLLWPLLSHIYIEMTKGRESRPALDFLRKYAYLVGPIENQECPVANKQNGSKPDNLITDDAQQTQSPPLPPSQIVFIIPPDDTDEANAVNSYFKELVQSLSMCLRIEEIESNEIIRRFRNAKYEMSLSLQSLYAIKHFLAKNGHVLILHILQNWFSFEINDALIDSDIDEADNDEETVSPIKSETKFDGDLSDVECSGTNTHNEIKSLLSRVVREIKTVNGLSKQCSSIPNETVALDALKEQTETNLPISSIDIEPPPIINTQHNFNVVQNKYLQNMRASVIRSRKMESPMRVFNILNADHKLCAADIDGNDCHLVCAFDDSTIKLWQLNQSRIRGRKPFSAFANRLCEWNLENCESSESSELSSSSSSDEEPMQSSCSYTRKNGLFGRRKNNAERAKRKEKRRQKKLFMEQRCDENVFSETEGLTLRGHNKGVTDVLFSKYNPLMFSVSKDNTMRAWKASDYLCGAIYRGHNYPIWCLAESSTGVYLATGSRDLTARLWSTEREFPLQTYIGHTQDVDTIAFHPNGNYIATGSTDLTVRLWDVTSGKLVRVFIDCHLPVNCVSFSPDGKYLAASGEETKIRIFDLAAGSQFTELKDHSASVKSIVWNTNGNKVASCCTDGTLRIFSLNRNSHSTSSTNLPSTNPSAAPVATSSSSSSSGSSSNKLLISNETGCKRTIKVFFNSNDTVTCIGNS